eukprot:3912213-Lingulodinium_polyedra.AAC.1
MCIRDRSARSGGARPLPRSPPTASAPWPPSGSAPTSSNGRPPAQRLTAGCHSRAPAPARSVCSRRLGRPR